MSKKKITNILSRWLPPLFWAAFIFSLSSYSTLPGPNIVWWDFILKKSAHMFVYAVLFFLIQRAINLEAKKPKYTFAMSLTLLYAISDELHQSYVFGRTALPSDIGFDMIGASLTMLKIKKII